MIAAARSAAIGRFMHRNAHTAALARRFVGGGDCLEARDAAIRLKRDGFASSLFYLGEYVADPELVRINVERQIAMAEALGEAGLEVHLSIDPTQIGYAIDERTGQDNALRIGRAVQEQPRAGRNCLMLDMEDHGLVDRTLALREMLVAEAVPTAQTLQAYLYRTERDLWPIVRDGGAVRLVKGAFADSRERAWQTRAEIGRSYLELASIMLSPEAKAAGFYPIFGTHDDKLTGAIAAMAAERGWQPAAYEFEMLYGVRPALQNRLRRAGHAVRLYVPFGTDWWPYVARRIGENPRNARFVLRALLGRSRA